MNKIKPMIYVACLGAYNNGFLHGEWIDATQEPDYITEQVQEMLKKSPVPNAEEWAIHDYSDFGGLAIEEYSSFSYVSALAKMLTADHNFLPEEIGSIFSLLGTDDPEQVVDFIQENYIGEFHDLGCWAQHILEETGDLGEVPKNLRYYFDFDGYGRDCELGGDIISVTSSNGKQHVFWNR